MAERTSILCKHFDALSSVTRSSTWPLLPARRKLRFVCCSYPLVYLLYTVSHAHVLQLLQYVECVTHTTPLHCDNTALLSHEYHYHCRLPFPIPNLKPNTNNIRFHFQFETEMLPSTFSEFLSIDDSLTHVSEVKVVSC